MPVKNKARRKTGRRARGPRVRRAASSSALTARSEARGGNDSDRPVLIGGALDPAEKAADRMAESVLSGHRTPYIAPSGPAVHRKCADCEQDEKAQRAAGASPSVAPGGKSAAAAPAVSNSIRSMGPGEPLAKADRAFFEPRFGRDFSSVRVHEDAIADRTARGIDARAFSYGNDIAFAHGEREKGGRPLLAHELAHVTQDHTTAQRSVRRATIASADGHKKYKKVPTSHRSTVEKALALIENAIKAKKCKDFFKDKCTGGSAGSAESTFNANTVYYLADHTTRFGLSDIRKVASDKHVVAYNQYAYDIGRWEIAATLLHEMFHTCDMTEDDMDEILAEDATETCGFYAPWITGIKPTSLDVGDVIKLRGYQLGQTQDADHYVTMGGVRITDYQRWEQPKSASSVRVEFKVPAAVNTNYYFSKDVELVTVNHGHESNKKTINVDP
jgi:hypothetical protein